MKLGESMETAYAVIDSTTVSRTLEKLYGNNPDDWMICSETSVIKDGVRYSKVQVMYKDKPVTYWFRHPSTFKLS